MRLFANKKCMRCFALFSLSMLCYMNSLYCGFAFDDASAIVGNKDLHSSTALLDLFKHDFWGTPLDKEQSHKSYRPLTVLTFRFNYLIHYLDPFGYHLTNIILHGLVVLLFFEVLNLLKEFLSDEIIFATAAMFAVHPIHVEAVTGLVGRAELLSALFYLSSLLTYVKLRQPLISIFAIFLGTFCKEQAVTGVGVCIVWKLLDFCRRKNRNSSLLKLPLIPFIKNEFKSLFVMVAGCIVILYLRFVALRGGLPYFTEYDNPAASAKFPQRHLTYNYLLALNTWLCLCPVNLCADWTMGTIPLISGFSDYRLIFIFLFWLCLTVVVYYCTFFDQPVLNIALSLLVFPYIPASNLFFPVGFVIAERVLYLPSMGFCLLIALGLQKALTRFPTFSSTILAFAVVSCFCLAMKTVQRNVDWKSEYSLFLSGLKVTQNNAKIFNNVGHALESENRFHEALPYFLQAAHVQPDDIGSWMNIGRTYMTLNDWKKAENYFLKAKALLPQFGSINNSIVRVAPTHLNVFINLGEVYKNQSRLPEAERMYRLALKMRPDFASAYMNLGDLLLRENRTEEALKIFELGLKNEPNHADLLYDTGIAYLKLGFSKKALTYFENALSVESDHVMSLINSAFILEEMVKDGTVTNSHREVALNRLQKASLIKQNDSRLFLELGNLQFEFEQFEKSLSSFKRCINLDPASKVALQNLALTEIQLGLINNSLITLNRLLSISPNNIRALLTICDVYGNYLKNFTATEMCYNQILLIDSYHVQAQHNLCIIQINSGQENKAHHCLERAKLLVSKNGPYTPDLYDVLQKKYIKQFHK